MTSPSITIDYSLGEEKNYLEIKDDRVRIIKPLNTLHSSFDIIKKEAQIQGINVEKFSSFDVALRKIDYVYYSIPQFALQGYILFHIKYTELTIPHIWNHKKMSNCFAVYRQNFDDVEKIIKHIKSSHPEISIEKA